MQYDKYPSPLGTIALAGDENGLAELRFQEEAGSPAVSDSSEIFIPVRQWLDAYFAGNPLPVTFPTNPRGTCFQQLIWQMLLEIPFGQTRTYGDLAKEAARRMGKKKMSAQAVGQAVGRNPIAIVIPCHRIVGAGDRLTGYAGGVDKKLWLLRHEGWKGFGKIGIAVIDNG